MNIHLLATAIAGALLLAACGKSSAPAAPAIAPTELAALDTPPPDYPLEVACAGVGGKAIFKVVVGTEGKPTQVTLTQSSGQPALDDSAQRKIPEWKFRAATREGQPVSRTIQVPVDFKPPQPRPDECFAIDERTRRGS